MHNYFPEALRFKSPLSKGKTCGLMCATSGTPFDLKNVPLPWFVGSVLLLFSRLYNRSFPSSLETSGLCELALKFTTGLLHE